MSSSRQRPRQHRQPYGQGQQRPAYKRNNTPNYDKALLNRGIYGNPRYMHAATCLIGCDVKVQVKNGGVYAGIFRTYSPEVPMSIVLELAHKIDDGTNPNQVPTKDRLVDKIVFELKDIVELTADNVDLDYAARDSFTDAAISKVNGQVSSESSLKELTPWDGTGSEEAASLDLVDASSSNGWDASEMFKTNEKQFNVTSNYDASLSQYTIPLTKENTKEYKDREAEAAKLASEIEGGESYRARIELENGDDDEEAKFSAVQRSSEQQSSNASGKYVPPHMRRGNPHLKRTQASHAAKQQSPSRESQEGKTNGDDRKAAEAAVAASSSPAVIDSQTAVGPAQSPAQEQHNKMTKERSPTDPDKRAKFGKDPKLEELKQFQTTFKLSDSQDSKDKKQIPNRRGPGAVPVTEQSPPAQQQPQPQEQWQNQPPAPLQGPAEQPGKSKQGPPHTPESQIRVSPATQEQPSLDKGDDADADDKARKDFSSKLNPNAKEFVFNPNAKSFTPRHPIQSPTPPRVPTQSPVMPNPQIAITGQYYSPQYVMPVSMQPQQQQHRPFQKRAVVSVQRQDFSHAQAVAATGQPLVAQPANFPQHQQYTIQVPHQIMSGAGTQGVLPQMMPRMMTPAQVVPVSHSDQQSLVQQQLQQPTALIVSPPQAGANAVPAHITQTAAGAQPHPAHMAPHHQPTPPHSQGQPSHIAPHPAPSPVHHPPTSGTPQSHMVYPQMAPQPPLQPSPHTPTSPQTAYPSAGMLYNHPSYQQMMMPTPTQMMASQQPQQAQPAHGPAHHQQQQQQQFVLMPQAQHQAQAQQAPHAAQMQTVPQFQPQMQGQFSGKAPVPTQMVPHSVSSATNVHQVHYVAHPQQMPSQAHPTPGYHPQ